MKIVHLKRNEVVIAPLGSGILQDGMAEEPQLTNATVAKYQLIASLGQGGMANVYLAQAGGSTAGFTKLAVVKMLRPEFSEDPDFVAMFLNEAGLAAKLNHQNVVSTFELGEDRGRHYIAMEYLEGQPFSAIRNKMRKDGGTPIGLSLYILHQVLSALQYAHELCDYDGTPLKIIHRDVTPQNVFLTYSGQTKLVDFGIAKAMNSSVQTRAGVIKGKVMYMAPEQARSAATIDGRADLFSVGVMMWESLTGRRLWKGKPEIAVLQALAKNEPIPSPRTVAEDVTEELERVCMKALSPNRDDRYATAHEFQADLEAAIDDAGYKISSRDAGIFLADNFKEERAAIRAAVDAHLLASKNADIPLADLAPAPESTHSTVTQAKLSSSSGLTPAATAGPASAPISVPPTAPPRAIVQQKSPMAIYIAGAGVIAAILIGAFVIRGNKTDGQMDVPAVTATQQTPKPPEEKIHVAIAAAPASAQMFLDDERLPNPYLATVPKDGVKRSLRIEAPGYVPKKMNVFYDNDISITLALEKKESERKK